MLMLTLKHVILDESLFLMSAKLQHHDYKITQDSKTVKKIHHISSWKSIFFKEKQDKSNKMLQNQNIYTAEGETYRAWE